MSWTRWLQEMRMKKFEQMYHRWKHKELRQKDVAQILDMSERTFRRYVARYEQYGTEGLLDKRIGRSSPLRASREEVKQLEVLYREQYCGRNVTHFYEAYAEQHQGKRSYSWVKSRLHEAGLVKRYKRKGPHRKLRERKAIPGIMLHQDASRHQWISGEYWDLVVTLDDATSEIYSAFFVAHEGTQSSLRGVREVLESRGLFSTLYTDRGSHYWHTKNAGGKVEKENLTQFRRAMKELGITMIAAYAPQARGRSERMFLTIQGRLVQELRELGIRDMEEANEYLKNTFVPKMNKMFAVKAKEAGEAFMPLMGANLREILCLKENRIVGNDNCVRYKGKRLQIPEVSDRYHFVRAEVCVHEYSDGSMSIWHGKRKVGSYDSSGILTSKAEVSRLRGQEGGSRSFRSALQG